MAHTLPHSLMWSTKVKLDSVFSKQRGQRGPSFFASFFGKRRFSIVPTFWKDDILADWGCGLTSTTIGSSSSELDFRGLYVSKYSCLETTLSKKTFFDLALQWGCIKVHEILIKYSKKIETSKPKLNKKLPSNRVLTAEDNFNWFWCNHWRCSFVNIFFSIDNKRLLFRRSAQLSFLERFIQFLVWWFSRWNNSRFSFSLLFLARWGDTIDTLTSCKFIFMSLFIWAAFGQFEIWIVCLW